MTSSKIIHEKMTLSTSRTLSTWPLAAGLVAFTWQCKEAPPCQRRDSEGAVAPRVRT